MDPNACLAEIKRLTAEARQGIDVRRNEREARWRTDELFKWLAMGGFPPDWAEWKD